MATGQEIVRRRSAGGRGDLLPECLPLSNRRGTQRRKRVLRCCDQDGRFAQVEETLSWTMEFPGGALASCTCTYGSPMPGYFRVRGSRGTVIVEPAFNYDKLHLLAQFEDGQTLELAPDDPDPTQFLREADHMADCILQNKEPKTSGQEGLRDMVLISQIYRSCERTSRVPARMQSRDNLDNVRGVVVANRVHSAPDSG